MSQADYSFLTTEMLLSDNLVPSKYAKQDVRLVYSKSNPAHLGWWFANTNGHEHVTLRNLIEYFGGSKTPGATENKAAAEQIKAIPTAYYKEE